MPFPVSKDIFEPAIGTEPTSVVFRPEVGGELNGAVPQVQSFDIERKAQPGRLIYPRLNESGGLIIRYPMFLYGVYFRAGAGSVSVQVQVVDPADVNNRTIFAEIQNITAPAMWLPEGGHAVIPAESILRGVTSGTGGLCSVEFVLKRAKSTVST